jgi:hypothetical protein
VTTHAASPVATTSAATSADKLGRMLLEALERHTGPAMTFRDGNVWVEWSFAEVGRLTSELARGLSPSGSGAATASREVEAANDRFAALYE